MNNDVPVDEEVAGVLRVVSLVVEVHVGDSGLLDVAQSDETVLKRALDHSIVLSGKVRK